MSYNLSISGHKDVADAEEGKAFEEEIAAKTRDFVATLDGATSAHGTFSHIGPENLLEPK